MDVGALFKPATGWWRHRLKLMPVTDSTEVSLRLIRFVLLEFLQTCQTLTKEKRLFHRWNSQHEMDFPNSGVKSILLLFLPSAWVLISWVEIATDLDNGVVMESTQLSIISNQLFNPLIIPLEPSTSPDLQVFLQEYNGSCYILEMLLRDLFSVTAT